MDISYESVLERKPYLVDQLDEIRKSFVGERILVTGAGGSIGSKIVSFFSTFTDIEVLATDRDENSLHSLSLEILGTALFNNSNYRVIDVRDRVGISNLFNDFHPTTVIHAAALKHLAILEKQPREAYLTNFIGTKNLLLQANEHKVKQFLNISTDKAASPKSILGKTKHMGEILTAYFRQQGNPRYTSVRFGNVFNSKGSVIETFIKQIKSGLPVTLTDVNVERYFMKIEEAAALSIVSLVINSGDIHLLDMGSPVKLKIVIEKLSKILDSKAVIQIVGLRPGEKLSEDLQALSEIKTNTKHRKINTLELCYELNDKLLVFTEVDDDQKALSEIDRFFKILNNEF